MDFEQTQDWMKKAVGVPGAEDRRNDRSREPAAGSHQRGSGRTDRSLTGAFACQIRAPQDARLQAILQFVVSLDLGTGIL